MDGRQDQVSEGSVAHLHWETVDGRDIHQGEEVDNQGLQFCRGQPADVEGLQTSLQFQQQPKKTITMNTG